MNSKQQTIEKIQELEAQLEVLKKDLKQKFPTIQKAKVGDVLEDGSIVVEKTNSMALIAAPESTDVYCEWSKEFQPVFDKLQKQGFNPSQWFIPTKEQLNLAYKNCKQHFTSTFYWSATEVSSTNACCQGFYFGILCSLSKMFTYCVRAFRVVNF